MLAAPGRVPRKIDWQTDFVIARELVVIMQGPAESSDNYLRVLEAVATQRGVRSACRMACKARGWK